MKIAEMTSVVYEYVGAAMLNKLKSAMKTLGLRGEDPLKTRQELIYFIDGRAAFVSQVTPYTYVKARAGTQYPKLFENADFLTSLKIAHWHIYGAAVCDLTLFAAAQLRVHGGLSNDAAEQFAASILDDILPIIRKMISLMTSSERCAHTASNVLRLQTGTTSPWDQ